MNDINKAAGGSMTIIGYCADIFNYHEAEAARWSAMQKAMLMAFPNLSEEDRSRIQMLLRRAREVR